MGCCNNPHIKVDEEALIKSIKESIRQTALRRLEVLLKYNTRSTGKTIDINESRVLTGDNMQLNIPAYTILTGNVKVFKFLVKKYTISIEKINEIFDKYNTNPVSIICINGYASFLQYFLPISLEYNSMDRSKNDLNTLNFSETKEVINYVYTPVQLACIKGHISCLSIILNYLKKDPIPWWLDVNYIDPVCGENCALVACKSGNYMMIKYLFSNTDVNFHVLNANNENALQIFLSSAKKQHISDQLTIVKFLVEDVKIDIRHHIEETLLICECYESMHYLYEKINEFGIEVMKVELETNFEIGPPRLSNRQGTIVIERSIESTIRDQENTYSINFSNVSKFFR